MKMTTHIACGLSIAFFLLVGCSGTESSAPESGGDSERDYSQLLDNVRKRSERSMTEDRINASIAEFEMENGRQPTNLVELVSGGFIESIPEGPEGRAYVYNPKTKSLGLLKLPETADGP